MTRNALLFAASVAISCSAAYAGCGSDDVDATPDASTPSTADGAPPGIGSSSSSSSSSGSGPDASCDGLGASCVDDDSCCLGHCESSLHVCVRGSDECSDAGAACGNATECCSLSCRDGQCADSCVSDGLACSSGAECCGGRCDNGTCTPLNGSCKTGGNACQSGSECCSTSCVEGRCDLTVSFCTQPGDTCASDAECCTGSCRRDAEAGAPLGVCADAGSIGGGGASGCKPSGVVCGSGTLPDGGAIVPCNGSGADCCSRSCLPFGDSTVTVCQPPSGCRPTGEICRQDTDCCGADGVPGDGNQNVMCLKAAASDPVGRCTNGSACRGAGQVCKLSGYTCSAENNCCAGNVNQNPDACQPDLLGIPRCTGVGTCTGLGTSQDGGALAGTACATSADCCGLPCVPNPSGDPAYVCGASCSNPGNTCSTDADCCSGLPCILQPGSSKGTCGLRGGGSDGGTSSGGTDGGGSGGCSFYGQSCQTSADCCNNVPCSGGVCRQPVN